MAQISRIAPFTPQASPIGYEKDALNGPLIHSWVYIQPQLGDIKGTQKGVKTIVFGIISWIIFGLIAGAIAKLLMPGRDPGGCIITMLLGIAGAIVGGFVAQLLRIGGPSVRPGDQGFLVRLAFAVLGAIIILAVYRAIAGRRA